MRDYIENRVKEVAIYMIDTKSTIRGVAKEFKVSKSTIHKDVVERLPIVDPVLYENIRKLLDVNYEERSIRGGLATIEKHKKLRIEKTS